MDWRKSDQLGTRAAAERERAAREADEQAARAYIERTQPDAELLLQVLGLAESPKPKRKVRRKVAAK